MSEQHQKKLEDKPFKDMTSREKVSFVLKAVVFLVSGGFIYPTLWID